MSRGITSSRKNDGKNCFPRNHKNQWNTSHYTSLHNAFRLIGIIRAPLHGVRGKDGKSGSVRGKWGRDDYGEQGFACVASTALPWGLTTSPTSMPLAFNCESVSNTEGLMFGYSLPRSHVYRVEYAQVLEYKARLNVSVVFPLRLYFHQSSLLSTTYKIRFPQRSPA